MGNEKTNGFKVSRIDADFSVRSRGSVSSDDDSLMNLKRLASPSESDGLGFDDADSGAASDDCDSPELDEPGTESCQMGDAVCCIPFELYDLENLNGVLSLESWNQCLTEEERFSLTQYLPDMDQHSFIHTLNDLFSGSNFHFHNPVTKLFDMLKGGLFEPRVSLYRQALRSFKQREHYHFLKNRHNTMVINLCQTRDAWKNCTGYSVEEKLRLLKIIRNQKKQEEDWSIIRENPQLSWKPREITKSKPPVTWKPGKMMKPLPKKGTRKHDCCLLPHSLKHKRSEPPLKKKNNKKKMKKKKKKKTVMKTGTVKPCSVGSSPRYWAEEAETEADSSDRPPKRRKRPKCPQEIVPLVEGVPDIPLPDANDDDDDGEETSRKKAFSVITPTVHTGFSFSIVHLISAVRTAMTPPDDVEDPRPATVSEIVDRVRSNPCDPSVLETQEPLQDLVRGVLRVLSSRTAPLGAKGWKPLASYDRHAKSWSWAGPPPPPTAAAEETTSPESWGLPHKVLVKLVDAFANWLKSGQETLRRIGTLPAPPESLSLFDERDRFRDLRAQKSLSTIVRSPDEVRSYFRSEELLRYSVPDRAFAYTAADGRKSVVAPLRRCGGKPTSKARDHFMLRRDRPPHVTILCLVRDAAARLPGSIGTRADVCTLIRDSQYIVEEVSDAQVNQVVSGALDRLHYERDPCVQFDGERKLWVYLHRDREEEDFEDDGTSSTKKWKRPKNGGGGDAVDGEPVLSADHPDLAPNAKYAAAGGRLFGDDIGGAPTRMQWDALYGETRLLCQQNTTSEDFDDESFPRDQQTELLGAGLS